MLFDGWPKTPPYGRRYLALGAERRREREDLSHRRIV